MIVEVQGRVYKLPDFLLIGAARCGTTTLYHCMKQHPDIFMPKQKEPFFFSYMECPPHHRDTDLRGKRAKRIVWQFDEYARLFSKAKDHQVIGEASTSYLYTSDITIEHIKNIYGDHYRELQLIAILRNPVDRAFSHYLMAKKNGVENLSFEEAIRQPVIEKRISRRKVFDYIGYGKYSRRLKAYLDVFPRVKIYMFEDLKELRGSMIDLFQFLDVDPRVPIDVNIHINPSGIPKSRVLYSLLRKIKNTSARVVPQRIKVPFAKHKNDLFRNLLEKPEMNAGIRKKLEDVFRDDVSALEQLIHRDLSHWKGAQGF